MTAIVLQGHIERGTRAVDIGGRHIPTGDFQNPRAPVEHVVAVKAVLDFRRRTRHLEAARQFRAQRHQPPLGLPSLDGLVQQRLGRSVVADRQAGKAGADEDFPGHQRPSLTP